MSMNNIFIVIQYQNMGNLLRHGIDTYKQTIDLAKDTPKQSPGGNVRKSSPPKALIRETVSAGKPKKPVKRQSENESSESKYRRVAKFLILIGSEQAAEILAELDPQQVEEVSKEIASIKIIKPEEKDEILGEFQELFSKAVGFSGSSRGGIETARRILYAAKGPEKGEELLNRAVPESKENFLSFLEEFSPEQLIAVFKSETAQTTSLILSRLPPKLSAGILSRLPPNLKPEVLKRMAHQKEISPDILEKIAEALREKVRHIGGGANDIQIDGMKTLAAILKQGDYAFGDKIINELETQNPEIGKDLKEKFYTLDDVVNAIDRPIQEKLSAMSEKEIAILLKGKEKEFCDKILSCVSAGRRQLIREEYEILGAVSKRDCDAVTIEFLDWFRKARENGDIILYSDEDVFL